MNRRRGNLRRLGPKFALQILLVVGSEGKQYEDLHYENRQCTCISAKLTSALYVPTRLFFSFAAGRHKHSVATLACHSFHALNIKYIF